MEKNNESSNEKLSVERKIRFPKTKTRGIYFEIFLGAVLLTFVVIPLITLLCKIDGESFKTVFTGGMFAKALGNSVLTTLISTIISVTLAYGLAWAISRTNIKFKALFSILLVLPMLIPSISHGMGLIILFGNNGLFTFTGTSHLYGYIGIILGSILYSFPVAFLMFVDILKYEDSTTYDAADVLGISKPRQFMCITLPYMRKALISIFFTVFTLIITDYGVPLAVGGKVKTLPVLLYENAVGQLDYSAGALIGIFLLVPAVVAFLIDLFNKDRAKSTFTTREFKPKKNKSKEAGAYIICLLTSAFVLLVIISFCLQAFSTSYPTNMAFTLEHFKNTFHKNGLTYLYNSVIMSLFTAFIGMVVSFATAYCTARLKTKMSKILHIISIISLSIPGLVLGLSYIIMFKSSALYGTLVILILVNVVHFFASPYQMLYNALFKMNENLESVGKVLGVCRFRVITDCIIPGCKDTLIEAFSYFFVNSMITISAVSFLATRNNKPLSLMINQFEAFNMLECAAVVAILILAVNILMKFIFYSIRNKDKIIYFVKSRGKKNVNKKTVWYFRFNHWRKRATFSKKNG